MGAFLKNAWYAAMWSGELPDGAPEARRILDEPVVLFRDRDGAPAALEDRCCHRAAPLSLGRCVGDALECGYHGLQFDRAGKCIRIPVQDRIPDNAHVRSYPVIEKWNAVWVWMGDPAAADEALIPDYFWMDDPNWMVTCGTIRMKGNYQLLIDNLLDFTHVTYLHRDTIAGEEREGEAPVEVERTDNSVTVSRWLLDYDPPPLFARAGGFNGKVDRWQYTRWTAPSTLAFDVGCAAAGTGAPAGNRDQGISIWSTHLITPEDETHTQYHWAYVRNFGLDDPEMTRLLHDGAKATFMEDVVMIEAQQERLGGVSIEGCMDIAADGPPLQMRRIMDTLIAAESGDARP